MKSPSFCLGKSPQTPLLIIEIMPLLGGIFLVSWLHLPVPHLRLLTGRAAVVDLMWLLHGRRAAGVVEKCTQAVYQ